jgi:MerR family copper efflux transcriptional regulator
MPMTIGQVASGAGVNVQTVRYYERRGLLPPPPRTESGYRQYNQETVPRLRFIKRAQELGFSLVEVSELLELRVEVGGTCAAVEARAQEKIAAVEQKIAELERIRVVLIELSNACDSRAPTSECPILRALGEDE